MRVLFILLLCAFLATSLDLLPGTRAGNGLVAIAAAREHPGSGTKEEVVVERPPVTIESVATYLEGYVAAKAKETDGWYRIEDEKAGTTLRLRLDHIHRERLAKTAERTWFVCADFKTPGEKVYDLDFWVRDTDRGLVVTESMVHKEAGKPRYSWVENEGVWSRKSLD